MVCHGSMKPFRISSMKIASWNVTLVRSRLSRVTSYFQEANFAVFLLHAPISTEEPFGVDRAGCGNRDPGLRIDQGLWSPQGAVRGPETDKSLLNDKEAFRSYTGVV